MGHLDERNVCFQLIVTSAAEVEEVIVILPAVVSFRVNVVRGHGPPFTAARAVFEGAHEIRSFSYLTPDTWHAATYTNLWALRRLHRKERKFQLFLARSNFLGFLPGDGSGFGFTWIRFIHHLLSLSS